MTVAYYSLKSYEDGPHMVVDPKGKWAWGADLAAARAEIERLTKERDLSEKLLRSCIQGNNALRKKAQKAEAERDEARSMLADAERDMRQRAADSCLGLMTAQSARKFILALPLKHADREGGMRVADRLTQLSEENARAQEDIANLTASLAAEVAESERLRAALAQGQKEGK